MPRPRWRPSRCAPSSTSTLSRRRHEPRVRSRLLLSLREGAGEGVAELAAGCEVGLARRLLALADLGDAEERAGARVLLIALRLHDAGDVSQAGSCGCLRLAVEQLADDASQRLDPGAA